MKTFRSARDVLAEVRKALAETRLYPGDGLPLERATRALHTGRNYLSTQIFLLRGDTLVRQCFAGAGEPCALVPLGKGLVGTAARSGKASVVQDVAADPVFVRCFAETKSELVVPIAIGRRVLGVINIDSERLNAFGATDRVLVKNVAAEVARFLTRRGKYVMRKLRESQPRAEQLPARHEPQSEREAAGLVSERRAAAGESGRS